MTEREERNREEGVRGISKQGREEGSKKRGRDDGRKGEKGGDRGVEGKAMGVRGEVRWLDEVMAKQGGRGKSNDKGRRERNKRWSERKDSGKEWGGRMEKR